MANIKTRVVTTGNEVDPGSSSAKGSALTHSEMDSNFLLLNNKKLENTTADFTGELKIKGSGSSATGAVRLYDNDDSHYVDLKSPDTISTSFTLKLPANDGTTGQVMITDGDGNMSWSSTEAGDITEIVSGNGLTGGSATGVVTLAVDVTDSNTVKDEDNMASDSATHLATQQSIKAYVDSTSGLSLIDEDNMATDSATRPPSQQSVKAYVDAQILTKDNSDEITEGSTNLYFTNARADARITNALKDEDNMSSNSATHLASQQSIKAYADSLALNLIDEDDLSTDSATRPPSQQSVKAYVDAQTLSLIDEDNMSTDSATRPPSQQSVKAYIATQIATKDNSDEITEGSSNLYFTNARADARITAALIDEDNMSTNSATRLPSQQSVKAYVDANGGGSGIASVVADTTPQLGGSLDVNGEKVVSVSNGDIDIEPHGTGDVLLGNFKFDVDQTVGAGTDNYALTYDNSTGKISLEVLPSSSNIVSDTSPQLGGDLDVQANKIVTSATNGNVISKPDHTGATGNYGATGGWGWGGGKTHINGPLSITNDDTPDIGELYNAGIQITAQGDSFPAVVLQAKSDNDRFGNIWFLRSGSDSGDARVSDGDKLGGFYASGYQAAGTGADYNTVSASCYFVVNGDHSDTNSGAMFQVRATNEDSTSERTVVNFKGNRAHFNPDNQNIDFRVDGDTTDNLLVVDAGTEAVSSVSSKIDFTNLPTSDPTSAGRLWNDSGTLKVSAG